MALVAKSYQDLEIVRDTYIEMVNVIVMCGPRMARLSVLRVILNQSMTAIILL